MWAFRTKVYYGKTFSDMKDSFITSGGMMPLELIKKIYDLQFVPSEASRILRDFPPVYRDIMISAFKDDGDVDLPVLEDKINRKLSSLYMQFFYIGSNVLPIISFVYMKKNEYNNVVKLVESLRYNLPFNAEEAS